MAKNASADTGGFWSGLLRFGLYKPNQGRIVRQVSFVFAVILALLSCYQVAGMEIWEWLLAAVGGESLGKSALWVMLVSLGSLAVWVCFRVINYPKFADFLIAVEAEMNKVSWPGRQELWRASLVVMFVIFAMAAMLYLYDLVWIFIFERIGIRYSV